MNDEFEAQEKRTMNATDKLVNRLTAFRNWAAMEAEMKAGYIPTLNGGVAYAKLAAICQRNGFKVFRCGHVS